MKAKKTDRPASDVEIKADEWDKGLHKVTHSSGNTGVAFRMTKEELYVLHDKVGQYIVQLNEEGKL